MSEVLDEEEMTRIREGFASVTEQLDSAIEERVSEFDPGELDAINAGMSALRELSETILSRVFSSSKYQRKNTKRNNDEAK